MKENGAPESIVQSIECDEPGQFIDELTGRGQFISNRSARERGHWIFRGHDNADYSLQPSALRPGAVFCNAFDSWVRGPLESVRLQIEAEASILLKFARMADEGGHSLPGGTKTLIEELNRWVLLGRKNNADTSLGRDHPAWPPDQLLPLCATAQHYGLPTRLLDWTFSPWIAAYFAAEGAARAIESDAAGDRMCVWAVSTDAVETAVLAGRRAPETLASVKDDPHSFTILKVDYGGQDRLRAQRGLFSLVRPAILKNLDDPVKTPTLGEVIPATAGGLQLYRVSLPTAAAGEVLHLVGLEFVDAAAMFPGLEGVSKAVIERRLWGMR